jgi:hypothetical protein
MNMVLTQNFSGDGQIGQVVVNPTTIITTMKAPIFVEALI